MDPDDEEFEEDENWEEDYDFSDDFDQEDIDFLKDLVVLEMK